MAAIVSDSYRFELVALIADPIVASMAAGLRNVPDADLRHEGEDNGPRFEFMMAANAEYKKRGGMKGGSIGAVAGAILWLRDTTRKLERGEDLSAEAEFLQRYSK